MGQCWQTCWLRKQSAALSGRKKLNDTAGGCGKPYMQYYQCCCNRSMLRLAPTCSRAKCHGPNTSQPMKACCWRPNFAWCLVGAIKCQPMCTTGLLLPLQVQPDLQPQGKQAPEPQVTKCQLEVASWDTLEEDIRRSYSQCLKHDELDRWVQQLARLDNTGAGCGPGPLCHR
jgi:hypothetical protein